MTTIPTLDELLSYQPAEGPPISYQERLSAISKWKTDLETIGRDVASKGEIPPEKVWSEDARLEADIQQALPTLRQQAFEDAFAAEFPDPAERQAVAQTLAETAAQNQGRLQPAISMRPDWEEKVTRAESVWTDPQWDQFRGKSGGVSGDLVLGGNRLGSLAVRPRGDGFEALVENAAGQKSLRQMPGIEEIRRQAREEFNQYEQGFFAAIDRVEKNPFGSNIDPAAELEYDKRSQDLRTIERADPSVAARMWAARQLKDDSFFTSAIPGANLDSLDDVRAWASQFTARPLLGLARSFAQAGDALIPGESQIDPSAVDAMTPGALGNRVESTGVDGTQGNAPIADLLSQGVESMATLMGPSALARPATALGLRMLGRTAPAVRAAEELGAMARGVETATAVGRTAPYSGMYVASFGSRSGDAEAQAQAAEAAGDQGQADRIRRWSLLASAAGAAVDTAVERIFPEERMLTGGLRVTARRAAMAPVQEGAEEFIAASVNNLIRPAAGQSQEDPFEAARGGFFGGVAFGAGGAARAGGARIAQAIANRGQAAEETSAPPQDGTSVIVPPVSAPAPPAAAPSPAPAPAAPIAPAPNQTATGPRTLADVAERAGRAAAEETVPELPETLAEQRARVVAGSQPAMLVPGVQQLPAELAPREGEPLVVVPTSEGILLTRAENAEAAAALVAEGRTGDALGYGVPRRPEQPTAAVVLRNAQGIEVQAAEIDDTTRVQVVTAFQERAQPGDSVHVEPREFVAAQRDGLAPVGPAPQARVQFDPVPGLILPAQQTTAGAVTEAAMPQHASLAVARLNQEMPGLVDPQNLIIAQNGATFVRTGGLQALPNLQRAGEGINQAEGYYDPATGRSVVFLDQVVRRPGETPEGAVARVIVHERVGHAGFFVMMQDADFARRWKALSAQIPAAELAALRAKGYANVTGEVLAWEWFAARAEQEGKVQLGGLVSRMMAAVRAWLDKALRPISRRAATDAEVRELIGLARQAAQQQGRSAAAASDPLASSPIRMTAAADRVSNLEGMTMADVERSTASRSFGDLQRLIDRAADAFGVSIDARRPMVGGWKESALSIETPETVDLGTQDWDVARTIAALVGAGAPDVQNAVLLWQDNDDGADAMYTFTATSDEAARRIADVFDKSGRQGFTYDPASREFSIAVSDPDATVANGITDFIERSRAAGDVESGGGAAEERGKGPGVTKGRFDLIFDSDYRGIIEAHQRQAAAGDARPADQGRAARANQLVAEVQGRLSAFEAAQSAQGGAPLASQPLVFGVPANSGFAGAVQVAGIDSALRIAGSQQWAKGRELKVVMQTSLATVAGPDVMLAISTPGDSRFEYLTQVGTQDALRALQQNPNAVGWYDKKTKQALEVVSLVHPEIKTNPRAQFAFIWAVAVTSNGMKVNKNFEMAEKVYRQFKETGKMPTNAGAGQAADAINDALSLYNQLVDQWGIDNLMRFMLTDFSVGQIIAIDEDIKPGGEWVETIVRGAAILGPKIGNGFFSNLYGKFDALTMDRWLVRTWGRWTGSLIVRNETLIAEARIRIKAAMDAASADPQTIENLKAALNLEQLPTDPDALAVAINKASQKVNLRNSISSTPQGDEMRLAANGLAKHLDGQKEAPKGPGERNEIRRVFQSILDNVRESDPRFAGLTMADLQAVLWYAEKRIYEIAKVADDLDDSGYEDDEAPDYANAAIQVARAAGVSEARIKKALKTALLTSDDDGRTTTARSGDGSQAGQQKGSRSRQQAAARGFTESERKQFRQFAALRRIRGSRRLQSAGSAQGKESWSYRREDRGDGGRARVLKTLGVQYVGEWVPGKNFKRVLKAAGERIEVPEFYELEKSQQSAAAFAGLISSVKASSTYGAAVYVYPQQEYEDMRMFVTKDGNAGFALKKDEIVSVFSAGGMGRAGMEAAIAAGGRRLDAFETMLPDYYAAHGFRAAARLPWNNEYKPAGWDKNAFIEYNNGEPDVVFMVLDEDGPGLYTTSDGKKVGDYDAGIRRQKKELKEIDAGRRARPIGGGAGAPLASMPMQRNAIAGIFRMADNGAEQRILVDPGPLATAKGLADRIDRMYADGQTDGVEDLEAELETLLDIMENGVGDIEANGEETRDIDAFSPGPGEQLLLNWIAWHNPTPGFNPREDFPTFGAMARARDGDGAWRIQPGVTDRQIEEAAREEMAAYLRRRNALNGAQASQPLPSLGGTRIRHRAGQPFRVNDLATRALLTGSPLPRVLVESVEATDRSKQAVQQTAAQIGREMSVAAERAAARTRMPLADVQRRISDVLDGVAGAGAALRALDPTLAEYARRARHMVDDLSEAIANTLPTGPLSQGIMANLGTWMRRSYAAFDQESGWNYDNLAAAAARNEQVGGRPAGAILRDARRLLRAQDPTATPEEIEATMRDLMDRDVVGQAIAGGSAVRKNVTSLIRRSVIDPEIRALMGEETNPIHRFAQSTSFQAQFLARHEGQHTMRRIGLAANLFRTTRGGVYTEQIPAGEAWSPLAGLWTTPQLLAAMRSADGGVMAGTDFWGLAGRSLTWLAHRAKMNRVALNPDSWVVNVFGGVVSVVASGDPFYGNMLRRFRQAVGLSRVDAAGRVSATNLAAQAVLDGQRQMAARLVASGVIGNTLSLGDLQATIPRAMLQWIERDATANRMLGAAEAAWIGQSLGRGFGLPGRAVGATLGAAVGAAVGQQRISALNQTIARIVMQTPDMLARLTGFMGNFEAAMASGLRGPDAFNWAADRTRNTFPDYGKLPAAIRDLSRIGVLGSFVAFQFEVYRNFIWNIRYIGQELGSQNPALRRRGLARLAGMGSVSALAFGGLGKLIGLLTGVPDDDERARAYRRQFAAPWERGAQLEFVKYDRGGVQYFNPSYLFPPGTMAELVVAARSGEDPSDSASRMVQQALQQFAGGSVNLSPVVAAVSGYDSAGRQLSYRPGVAGAVERIDAAAKVMLDPGYADKVERLVYAGRGAERKGRAFSAKEEGARLAGIRAFTRTWPQLVENRLREFAAQYRDIRAQANKDVGLNLPGASRSAVAEANERLAKLDAELERFRADAKLLGVPPEVVRAGFKDSALPTQIRSVELDPRERNRVRTVGGR